MGNSFHSFPDNLKNRPQQPPDSHLPEEAPGEKTEGIAQSQIAAADPEADFQPQPHRCREKQKVRPNWMAAPQRTQRAVDQT